MVCVFVGSLIRLGYARRHGSQKGVSESFEEISPAVDETDCQRRLRPSCSRQAFMSFLYGPGSWCIFADGWSFRSDLALAAIAGCFQESDQLPLQLPLRVPDDLARSGSQ